VPVLGRTDPTCEVVARKEVEEIVVAMPSAPKGDRARILNAAADAGVQTRVMPELVIAKGSVSLRDLRAVDVEDLLGREPTPIDVEQVRETLAGKVVAVTGAAGSIGAELCRQIMRFEPERLLLIEIDESRLYELWLELETVRPGVAEMVVCDIRDADGSTRSSHTVPRSCCTRPPTSTCRSWSSRRRRPSRPTCSARCR
jgi:FlaA1/EpsC-like NDP-sugar epimerase